MTISNFCVGFVVFIGLLVITGIIGLAFMWVTDEESSCMIFFAWFISTIGLAICLTYILVTKGFIQKGVEKMSERCKTIDRDLSRNGSGYYDPTAYKAMKRVEADEKKYGRDYERFYNLLNTIFYICELAGFHVEGRIVLTDKKTGKVWK